MKAIIACENKQELDDLIYLIKKSSGEINPTYFDMSQLLGTPKLEGSEFFTKNKKSINIFGDKFKNLSPLKKILSSIVNGVILAVEYKKTRSDILITGTPLLTLRVARIISFGKIKTAVLIRGVIAYSSSETSLSSMIFLKIKNLAKIGAIQRIVSDYYGDLVFCTGEITKNFIMSRLVPEENLIVAGSLYCDRQDESQHPTRKEGKCIVFISSALEFHGYRDAQDIQTKMIEELITEVEKIDPKKTCTIQVRKHPRENIEIYKKNKLIASHLDESLPPTSEYPEDTLFISPISTLAFELAYQKRNSQILTTPELQDKFSEWYASMGIENKFNWREVIKQHINNERIRPMDESERVISTKFRGAVAEKILVEIKNKLSTNNAHE